MTDIVEQYMQEFRRKFKEKWGVETPIELYRLAAKAEHEKIIRTRLQ